MHNIYRYTFNIWILDVVQCSLTMECLLLMFTVCLLLQFPVSQDQTAWSQFVSQGSSYHLHKDRFWSQIRKLHLLSPSTPRRWQSEVLQFQSPRKRGHRKTQTPADFRLLLSAPTTHELGCIQFTLIGDWWFQNRSENMPFNIMIQMEGYGSRIVVDEIHPQIVLNMATQYSNSNQKTMILHLCLRGHSFHSVFCVLPFHSLARFCNAGSSQVPSFCGPGGQPFGQRRHGS